MPQEKKGFLPPSNYISFFPDDDPARAERLWLPRAPRLRAHVERARASLASRAAHPRDATDAPQAVRTVRLQEDTRKTGARFTNW
jgi:hypothetical protein